MFILHLALGGCLKAPPVSFGITADTGGHIAYVLDAALAQAELASVTRVSVVTRLFDDDQLGLEHGRSREWLGRKIAVERIATGRRGYLEKEALADDLPAFTDAFCAYLSAQPSLPDIIHAHFADAAAVALVARARFGIPFVYTPHALGIDKRAQQPGREDLDGRIVAERHAIAMADAIVVSTRDEADRQVQAYGVADAAARTLCLLPGVPRREPAHASAALPGRLVQRLPDWLDDPGKPIVLAVARPVRKKNLAALVRAFAATPALAERANLVILAGQHGGRHASAEECEVIGELERLCADAALRGCVALPPRHDSGDVAALYEHAADRGVFANVALHEPFGLTLIEAAAAGVPVVATCNGGPAEIVGTIGHGLLVDPRDRTAIATACLGIISDASLHHRLSQAASRNIGCYSWSVYAGRSASLYASLGRAAARAADRDREAIRDALGVAPDVARHGVRPPPVLARGDGAWPDRESPLGRRATAGLAERPAAHDVALPACQTVVA